MDLLKHKITAEKVIDLYLAEDLAETIYSRSREYREASKSYKLLLESVAGKAEEKEIAALEHSIDELLALTERLSFQDGFICGVRHVVELAELICNTNSV